MEIRKNKTMLTVLAAAGLLMPACGLSAYAETAPARQAAYQARQQVTGVVTDAQGEPLIGVTVLQQGTNNGASTDIDGRYSLSVPANSTLTFSYVGYKTQSVALQGRSTLNVSLAPDAKALDEVVVVGYGTVRKADMAGSVAVLSDKAFQAQPITNVAEAFQGRVSGVNVVQSGYPGQAAKIRVRGTNSINKSNDPLYVVDGMVRNSGLDGINPEDIQSIQILKDASSTAIYGARGANGVVIITTKSGTKGETRVTLDASVGWAKATKLPEKINAQQFAQSFVDFRNWNKVDLQGYLDGSNPGIDYIDENFRTGLVQQYQVQFDKGTDDYQMFISASYTNQEGVVEKSDFERYSARVNVSAKLTDWLDVTADITLGHSIGKGQTGAFGSYDPLWMTYTYTPAMELRNADGYYNWDPYQGNLQQNPYGLIHDSKSERRRDIANGHIDLRFHILPELTFTTSNGVDYYNNTSYNFGPSDVNGAQKSSMGNSNYQYRMLQSTNNLTYVGTFGEKNHLTATAVWEATKSYNRNMGISATNLLAESVGWWDVKNGTSFDASNGYNDWSLLSAVARVMYNYDNRYMLTATFRADGSSRFAAGNKWGYFPSVAAAWTISNESFMADATPWLSNLKLRASWGIIGNQDIGAYQTIALLNQTQYYYGPNTPVVGYWNSSVATPGLKWEKTKQFDAGLDMSFLNMFDLSFDFYTKTTSDALLQTSLPAFLGGSAYMINAGSVRNTGVELSLTAHLVNTPEWHWSTTITGTHNKNKVTKLTAEEPRLYSGDMASVINNPTITEEGHPIGTFYGFEWAGINADGLDTYYTLDADGNHTGVTTTPDAASDRTYLGNANPTFTLGWNNTVNYKRFSLNVFFNGAFGAKRLNALRYAMSCPTGPAATILLADCLTHYGQGTDNPIPYVNDNQALGNSSKWIEKADYFRCENISLAYDLPKAASHFADLRFSFGIQNLFTITGYKGSNPAGFNFHDDYGDRANGVDTGTYPTPRTYTLGVRMSF